MAKRAVTVKSADKSGLLLAFDHVALVSKGPAAYAPYALFQPGWLVGYDGIVAVGARISEDMRGAPHTDTFRQALMRAGNPYSITHLSSGNYIVSGDKVRVEVPVCDPTLIPNVSPDAAVWEINPAFSNALINVYKITASRETSVIGASVNVGRDSAVATNGNTIIEAYHGVYLPRKVLLPREFVEVLSRTKYTATHAGWGDGTFTMWFGPNAFIRCNVYDEAYPDTDVFFAQMIADSREWRDMPTITLQAVETLKPFMDASGSLAFTPFGLNTKVDCTGASFTFDHYFPADSYKPVPYEALRYAAAHAQAISFSANGLYWYGPELRGITKL